jgi:hypothetical protein
MSEVATTYLSDLAVKRLANLVDQLNAALMIDEALINHVLSFYDKWVVKFPNPLAINESALFMRREADLARTYLPRTNRAGEFLAIACVNRNMITKLIVHKIKISWSESFTA